MAELPKSENSSGEVSQSGALPPKGVRELDDGNQVVPSYIEANSASQWLAGMDKIPEVAQYKEMSYRYLGVHPGMRILDLGCGVGDDASRIAKLVCPGGSVLGIDANRKMIEEAQARHEQAEQNSVRTTEGGSNDCGNLHFLVGSAEGLPAADKSFDAVRADRVLQHVSDPLIALREVQRVLCPGGKVVLVEPDWRMIWIHPGSATSGDDDHVLQAILSWQVAHTRHGLMGRQLGARLRQAGFNDIQVMPVAYSIPSFAVARYALELDIAGEAVAREKDAQVDTQELQDWFRAAERAEQAGEFSGMAVLTFATGHKALRTGWR